MVARQKYTLIASGFQLLSTLFIITIGMMNDFSSAIIFLFKAAYFPIVLLTLLLFLVSNCLIKDKRYIFITLLTSSLLVLTIFPNIFKSDTYKPETDKKGFNVASFSAMGRSNNGEDIVNFVKKFNPDIFCLQEVKENDITEVLKLYPYSSSRNTDLIILSRFPVKTLQQGTGIQPVEISLPESQNSEKLLLLNVHMPRQYRDDKYFPKAKNDLTEMVDVNQPVILCGDFNLTPKNTMYSYVINQLKFNDAQMNQTWNYGFTFPNSNRRLAIFGTWIRIDYLFYKDLYNGSTSVFAASKLSDHKAVISSFMVMK